MALIYSLFLFPGAEMSAQVLPADSLPLPVSYTDYSNRLAFAKSASLVESTLPSGQKF
jgi:hypothetical protein